MHLRDYKTMEKLLVIELLEDEMRMLIGKPFSQLSPNGGMEKADTLSRRLRELRVRAEHLHPPTIYDCSAEGLYLICMFHYCLERPRLVGAASQCT